MKKSIGNAGLGIAIPKRVRIAGMTFYLRNGQRNHESFIIPDARHSGERRSTTNDKAGVGRGGWQTSPDNRPQGM